MHTFTKWACKSSYLIRTTWELKRLVDKVEELKEKNDNTQTLEGWKKLAAEFPLQTPDFPRNVWLGYQFLQQQRNKYYVGKSDYYHFLPILEHGRKIIHLTHVFSYVYLLIHDSDEIEFFWPNYFKLSV